MFIVTIVFPMELFMQQGESQETPKVLNTPQEKVRTSR